MSSGTSPLRLRNVLFEVTARCNLACRHCYVPWEAPQARMNRGRPGRARDEFERADRTLARLHRIARVDGVTMTGGEPLAQERLEELVLRSRLAGSRVNIISNGTLGTPERWRGLARLGVALFELPLHAADAAVHDRLSGRRGAWEATAASIRTLRALAADVVGVVVLTRDTAPSLADTLALHAALGVRQVMLNRFNPGGRGLRHLDELTPAAEDLCAAFATADRLARPLGLNITSNVALPHCLVDPHEYLRVRFTSCSADLDRRPLALDLDGDLRFCNHSPVVFANIHRDPPATLLDSAYLRAWRDTVPAACAGCERFARCFGGCRATCEQMGGTLADADPMLGEA
ncbi:MAG: radical SAM protein [Candidatus Krumholzibacteriia bacterium]